MRHVTLMLVLLAGLFGSTLVGQIPPAPSLLVVLAIDQLRADYLDRFRHQWTKGWQRLLTEGAWLDQASFPYFNTVTCAGHATISTGAFPATHGVMLNDWYDREAGRLVGCTRDSSARTVSYGAPVTGGQGPAALIVPTLADELVAQLSVRPRIVTLSHKARSAIMLAGRHADVVTWFDERVNVWATSSAYGEARSDVIERFLAAHPLEQALGSTWDRALAADRYDYEPTTPEAVSKSDWGLSLPHVLGDPRSGPERSFYAAWLRSPQGDRYLADMAMAAIDDLGLGQADRTDYLAIGFSGLDRVGHDYGPRSHEVQDTLARLDDTLDVLIAHLDRTVGRERYVLALTSDHGVGPIPEQLAKMGFDAGRLDVTLVEARAEEVLKATLGPANEVARVEHTELYFAPGVYGALQATPDALRQVIGAIESVPGVARVYRGEHLLALSGSANPVERALALSYVPGRSGDLIVVPKIYWTTSDNAAGHGTSYGYDARVPIVLLGRGIKPGRHLGPATPADIAPTLAWLAGVTLAKPDGRLLSEVLTGP